MATEYRRLENPASCRGCKRKQFVMNQGIYVGGPRSGLVQCANCGKVLWAVKSAAAIV